MIVIDLEMTCCDVESFPKSEMEIIQIGAVKLDDSIKIVSTYSAFVRPVIHPQLTDFCSRLLHISQSDVDSAQPFDVTFDRSFLTWLKDECKRHLRFFPFNEHVNLARALGANQRRRLREFGMEWRGRRHDGLADALTYAEFVIRGQPTLKRKPC